jgi:hypothetical protein
MGGEARRALSSQRPFLPKADLGTTISSSPMIPDAELNHALHVGIVRFHVRVPVLSPLFQPLRPFLGALSGAALPFALIDAHA